MAIARITRISGEITLLITIFSLSLPAYAQYSGGTGEPDDPYLIATAEDLIVLGETSEDYDKHFILTADIDLDPNLPGLEDSQMGLYIGTGKAMETVTYFSGLIDEIRIYNRAVKPWCMFLPVIGRKEGFRWT